MQIQQEILRQWVNQWFMATAAAVGSGRTKQIQTMQKRRLENSTEVMNKHREALDPQSKSGVRMSEDAFRITEAAILPRRHGDGDVPTAASRGATTAPSGAPAEVATAPRTGEGARIQVREE